MLRPFTLNEVYYLLVAAQWTVLLAAITCVGGGILGLLIATLRVTPSRVLRGVAIAYIQFFQGTPLLIQLFMVYFGTAFIGLRPDAWTAAVLTFIINAAAFFAEIFRGSIQAIPGGQWEVSKALGLRFLPTLRFIILPQAFRLMLPPTVGFMVQIVKGTSVASLIGLTELARTGTVINTVTFEPALVFGTVGLIYFALCWPLSLLGSALERRLARQGIRGPRTPETIAAQQTEATVGGTGAS